MWRKNVSPTAKSRQNQSSENKSIFTTARNPITEPIFISQSEGRKILRSSTRPQSQMQARNSMQLLPSREQSKWLTGTKSSLGSRSEVLSFGFLDRKDELGLIQTSPTDSDFPHMGSEDIVRKPDGKTTSEPRNRRRKSFADTVRPIVSSISLLARRMLKQREVLEGFSGHAAEQVCLDLWKLNHLIQSLRRKLGAVVDIPQPEQHIETTQVATLIKLAIMSLYQSSSGLAAEAEAGPACDTEACAMAAECGALVASLSERFEGDARITPAAALRTLATAKRSFGTAVLGHSLHGQRVANEDELVDRLRPIFAELDSDGSGAIRVGLAELRAAMASLEVPVADAGLRRFLAATAADAGVSVGFAEFCALAVAILRENGIALLPTLAAASPPSASAPSESSTDTRPSDPAQRAQPWRSSDAASSESAVTEAAAAGANGAALPYRADDLLPPLRQSVPMVTEGPAGRRGSWASRLASEVRARRRSSIEAAAAVRVLPTPQYSHLRFGALGLRGGLPAP